MHATSGASEGLRSQLLRSLLLLSGVALAYIRFSSGCADATLNPQNQVGTASSEFSLATKVTV